MEQRYFVLLSFLFDFADSSNLNTRHAEIGDFRHHTIGQLHTAVRLNPKRTTKQTRNDPMSQRSYEDVASGDVAMHDAFGMQMRNAARRAQRNVTQIAIVFAQQTVGRIGSRDILISQATSSVELLVHNLTETAAAFLCSHESSEPSAECDMTSIATHCDRTTCSLTCEFGDDRQRRLTHAVQRNDILRNNSISNHETIAPCRAQTKQARENLMWAELRHLDGLLLERLDLRLVAERLGLHL